jgi:hypothetical protein
MEQNDSSRVNSFSVSQDVEREVSKLSLTTTLFYRYKLHVSANDNTLRLKCDGTRAETKFLLSAKRTSQFKSAGVSVHSTTGRRGVRISDSTAEYTMFRGSVKGTGYPLHFSSFPFTSSPVRHRVPSHFN